MNKKILSLFSILPLLIGGCGGNENQPPDDKKDQEGGDTPITPQPEEKMTYKEIYHYEYQKAPAMTGKKLYRASDGYIQNDQQGYNNFFYLAKIDGVYNNLLYEQDAFRLNGAIINQEKMTSVEGASAVRCFLAPIAGSANISGSAFLIEGESAHLKVFKNNDLIAEKTIDKDGVYHFDNVNLNVGDNVYFVIEGNATVSYNPVVDYTLAEEVNLHHSADGFYGDVHPFYDYATKKMHMFYLSTGNQSGTKYQQFESLLTTSTDFIHYVPETIQMNERGRPEQDLYYVLNVFKDKNGVYRSSMGTANHTTTSISNDLHTWSNGTEAYVDPVDDMFKYRFAAYYDDTVFNGRDPDMCYDRETDKYYTVSIVYHTSAKAAGDKSIQLYIANNKGEFEKNGHRLLGFEGRGDPECPQIKKIGNRWYLIYSVYGTGTKGNVGKLAYRVGDENTAIKDVNWESKPELYLDGEDLHAAQINEVGDKYYAYGWLNYIYNTNVWGGYLNLPHEIYQDENGILRSRLDEELLRLLNKGIIYKDNKTYTENTNVNVKLTRNLITADLDMSTNNYNTGLKITHGSDAYFIGIVTKGVKKYLTVKNEFDGYSIETEAKAASKYHLTISLDGNFLDINVNDDTTLSAFTNLTNTNKSLDIVSSGNKITNLKINKLADYNNIYF